MTILEGVNTGKSNPPTLMGYKLNQENKESLSVESENPSLTFRLKNTGDIFTSCNFSLIIVKNSSGSTSGF